MFSCVCCRMATESCTEVPLEEGHESFSETQVESLKRGLSEAGLTDPIIDPAEPPKRDGHQSSSERQVPTPIRGFSKISLTDPVKNGLL